MKCIFVEKNSLPEAWEQSVIECWNVGERFQTQYDKPADESSRDVVAMIHVKHPMAEPRIHRAMPAGLNDMEKYRSEVLYGVHDHWIKPEEGKWNYTYHKRLFEYGRDAILTSSSECAREPINQIKECIELLKKCGYTRRAQAVTWKVWEDLGISDPACLQRMWFRVEQVPNIDIQDFVPVLNMTVHMRSNDAHKAAFMNMYAFTELQKYVADQVGVEVGSYVHIADSYHIYGSYFNEFEKFLETVASRNFEDRVWSTDQCHDEMIVGCDELLEEKDMPQDKRELVIQRKKHLESLVSGV